MESDDRRERERERQKREHALSKREISQIPKRIEDDNDDDDADDNNTLQVSRLPSNWGKCRLGSEEEAAGNFHVQALFAPAGLINRRGRNLTCKVRKTTLIFFRATSERAKFIKRLKHSCSWIAVKLNEFQILEWKNELG